MATITRGRKTALVKKIKQVLDDYERAHAGASASLYQLNSFSVRVRIVDKNFKGESLGDRHDRVWDFMSERLNDDELQQISMLLLLDLREQKTEFLNLEFNDPLRSAFL